MGNRMDAYRSQLKLSEEKLGAVTQCFLGLGDKLFGGLYDIIEKYGGVEEINRKAKDAGRVENLLQKLESKGSSYVADLQWLIEQRDKGAFISMADYRRTVLGDRVDSVIFDESSPVTLEISSLHFFPWLIAEAKQAVANRELMPSRFIRVRYMKEQEEDNDLAATTAAMQIVGATWCETLDTKGVDGSNVHLGGADTITGYFGGIGQPNDYPLKWIDEYLYYHTTYGTREVLNFNFGTILLAMVLHKLGVDIRCKISVFAGHDNPYFLLWTLSMAKLFSRDDGSTALSGLNFSNSVNNATIELSADIRKSLGFEDHIRFEHHIFEPYLGIVRQPYDRRAELLDLVTRVGNVSAKHEGGEPEVDGNREHQSNILEYFLKKDEVYSNNLWDALQTGYLDKHTALNNTARALTEKGISVVAATNLHL